MDENKFYDLEQDTVDMIDNLIEKIAMPFTLKIKKLGVTKMKQLVKIQKTSDITNHMTSVDLFIFINEDYFIQMDELVSTILIHQELDRLEFDMNKGVFKIGKYPLQTTTGVLKKYGIDAVAEANQLLDLVVDQEKDKDKDDINGGAEIKTTKIVKNVDFLD